jgi:hypothetical protein
LDFELVLGYFYLTVFPREMQLADHIDLYRTDQLLCAVASLSLGDVVAGGIGTILIVMIMAGVWPETGRLKSLTPEGASLCACLIALITNSSLDSHSNNERFSRDTLRKNRPTIYRRARYCFAGPP